MNRKNTATYFCVVCRDPSNGAGITSEEGVHICFECAEMIYNVMGQWHEAHLDRCECTHCRKSGGISSREIEL